ncbi:MAG: hypothetical protein ACKVS5_11515 [Parvularculaceae bacterium]
MIKSGVAMIRLRPRRRVFRSAKRREHHFTLHGVEHIKNLISNSFYKEFRRNVDHIATYVGTAAASAPGALDGVLGRGACGDCLIYLGLKSTPDASKPAIERFALHFSPSEIVKLPTYRARSLVAPSNASSVVLLIDIDHVSRRAIGVAYELVTRNEKPADLATALLASSAGRRGALDFAA